MPQSNNYSTTAVDGSGITSNNHTLNPQLQQALALQRLKSFMADPTPTSMSTNTCGHTTVEISRSRMAGKLTEFDERFSNTSENGNINKG